MLLHEAQQFASFDPHQILINWGFSRSKPILSTSLDNVEPIELSSAIHEFTHQSGMYSEMGLWYLHSFWKFFAEVHNPKSAVLLLKREKLWEAWWLTTFLLEGQAMYAQLHLIPSPDLEITSPQFDFVRAIGLDSMQINAGSPESIRDGIQRLFSRACSSCHENGTKHSLLTADSKALQPYLLGYLFFRTAQAYLSQFDTAFRKPEVFYVFICNLLFNNCFEQGRSLDILDRSPVKILDDIVDSILKAGPASSQLLEPIREFPSHPVNYFYPDYLASLSSKSILERPSLNQSIRELAQDILKFEENLASFFVEAAMSLQFYQLKSFDAHIVSVDDDDNPFLTYLAHNPEGVQLAGMAISRKSQAAIRRFALKKDRILINGMDIFEIVKSTSKLASMINEFADCEIHFVIPMVGARAFKCLATEEEFLVIDPGLASTEVSPAHKNFAAKKGYSEAWIHDFNQQQSASHLKIIRTFEQSAFVRSRRYRHRLIDHFLSALRNAEEYLHEHLSRQNPGLGRLHDPVEMKDRSFDLIKNSFDRFIWNTGTYGNPISRALAANGLSGEFHLFCNTPPIDKDVYSAPAISAHLNECIQKAFEGNVFFKAIGEIPKATEFL